MTALDLILQELERFHEASGMPADRIVVPPNLLKEALLQYESLMWMKCKPGNKNMIAGAWIETGDTLQARSAAIPGFVVDRG